MRKSRVLTGLAVSAIAALSAAAPASAQTSPRPCDPTIVIPQTVNCVFDTSQWALAEARTLPDRTVEQVQTEFNALVDQLQVIAADVTGDVDAIQKQVVGTACFILGIPPESCPQI